VTGPITRRWRKLARASTLLPLLQPLYEVIAGLYVPGQTVVVASGALLGARIAHDRLKVPLVTVHLSPAALRSAYDTPLQPPLRLPVWLPSWAKRAGHWLLDALVVDRLLAGPVNAFRAELGLPPVRRVFQEWRHSPRLVLGLFPPWFAWPQPDWPPQTRLTGFPLYDESDATEVPPGVREFLDAGAPPVVFTAGSACRDAHRFFRQAVRVCQHLGCRGLLLTRFQEQVPPSLPQGVCHFDYIPFSQVLPRAAALIHPGGIGSCAQALAAGIPQVVLPLKNDQPDNARRLERLGVAHVLRPGASRTRTLVQGLDKLLRSPQLTSRCRPFAALLKTSDLLNESCRLIEQVGGGQEARVGAVSRTRIG
jgi:UDP:flavonoid glycosyltransferase YjiC (YdhE family)